MELVCDLVRADDVLEVGLRVRGPDLLEERLRLVGNDGRLGRPPEPAEDDPQRTARDRLGLCHAYYRSPMTTTRPGPLTLAAFAGVVGIGGTNFVGVRLTNRELDPFYSAGIRFAAAAAVLLLVAAVARIPLPRGRALIGTLIYGGLQFSVVYALAYWGLERAPAALAGVIFGATPLFTLLLAAAQRQERFRLRAAVGALIAVAGVLWIARAPINEAVPIVYVGAIALSMMGAAQAGVTIKRFPPVHPIAMNGVGMAVGTPFLFVFSLVAGESWTVPRQTLTWGWLVFLVLVGSVGMFALYVYVVQHWTATGASYQFVFFPIVTPLIAALIADESLSGALLLGGVLVVVGTYVGAFATTETRDVSAAPSDRSA